MKEQIKKNKKTKADKNKKGKRMAGVEKEKKISRKDKVKNIIIYLNQLLFINKNF